MTHTRVDSVLGHVLERHPGALQHIQHFSHVAFGQRHERLFAILSYFDSGKIWFVNNSSNIYTIDLLFAFDYVVQARQNLLWWKRSKPEASAARLKRRNDFRLVVTDYAESYVFGVLFNNWNKKSIVTYTEN